MKLQVCVQRSLFLVLKLKHIVKMRTEEKPNGSTLHVTVMGSSQVGKSALAVRYLTKRFIGEYRSDSGKLHYNILLTFQTITLICN